MFTHLFCLHECIKTWFMLLKYIGILTSFIVELKTDLQQIRIYELKTGRTGL
ncbi:hypothetical protein SOVF_162200 [Spinacia oleracea]|nr:hypothetical protein SOVF_162200 [Spinacia oleracea]